MSDFDKLDNSTLRQKFSLRRVGLSLLRETPVVMETHGGMGEIYSLLYHEIADGVVFDTDPQKCNHLAHQRPTWAVYQADSAVALAQGAGAHLAVNFLDVDPYGDSWPTINAFFSSERTFSKRMVVAVNDGLRHKIGTGGAWSSKSLEPIVKRWGNDLWHHYIDACRELMKLATAEQGYKVVKFEGYHCGALNRMTHFIALLER